MSDIDDLMTVDFSGLPAIQQVLDAKAKEWHYKIQSLYIQAASDTLDGSQQDVPVGETGELKDSGRVGNLVDNGPENGFSVEVIYGDGQSMSTVYDYPASESTSKNTDSDMEADGYALITELGHVTPNGTHVIPQPFLGPNFDLNVLALESKLLDVVE